MHPLANDIRGLYAIADTGTIDEAKLLEKVGQVLAGGCRVLQYRDKSNNKEKRLHQAKQLRAICRQTSTVFIINDDAELAMQVNADGVHCGRNDAAISETKSLYPGLLIGASCYNSLQRARQVAEEGADYLAFGRFFSSQTKPEAAAADINILQQAKQKFDQPLVAIGGVMPENAGILISCGASAVAVIGGVFSATDPYLSSQKISALFNNR